MTFCRFTAMPTVVGMAVLFGGLSHGCPALAASLAEVLIYYANETAPDVSEAENYATIMGWLRSSGDAGHRRVAEQLERDVGIFAKAVDVESAEIMLETLSLKSGPEVVIFTNRLVRDGTCLIWKRGAERFETIAFVPPDTDHLVLKSNPLSDRDVFTRALALVAEQFPPPLHRFVLITKSHGSREKALTPRLAVRAEETNREELLKVASPDTPDDELPSWVGRLGVSKADYLTTLAEAGQQRDMRFSLVFLEACEAATEEVGPDRLPPNVDRLLLMRQNSNYINILWADVLRDLQPGERLADAAIEHLPAKFLVQTHDSPPINSAPATSWPLWVYFAPLLAWGGGLVAYRRLRRRSASTSTT